MISFSILVVDDESNQRETLIEILSDSGFAVEGAEDVESAKVKIENKKFNLVLSDFKMPGGSGLDVAKKALEMDSKTVVMMMTAYADVGSVISAMQAGVADYLLKPLNIDSVIRKVEVLKENFELKTEINRLRAEINSPQKDNRLIGSSPAIQKVRNIISQVALTKGTVLITGESGTGKEVAARMIHSGSSQKDKKFIAINCGAIPENLLESELFGHKKGSFTGAVSDKEGLLSMARGGSVFLDEIGDMPKSLQVKILRAIQEREILPVGGHQPIKIDARLIAATNRDLKADVENGLFRQDLYYRINVVEIVMPPLRDRREDIPELCQTIVKKYALEMGKGITGLSHEALRRMMSYTWPGNVRELENVIERAIILSQNANVIEPVDLPAGFQHLGDTPEFSLKLDDALNSFAKQHIAKILESSGGDKKQAAKILGLSLSSLYRKLEELGISTHKDSPAKGQEE